MHFRHLEQSVCRSTVLTPAVRADNGHCISVRSLKPCPRTQTLLCILQVHCNKLACSTAVVHAVRLGHSSGTSTTIDWCTQRGQACPPRMRACHRRKRIWQYLLFDPDKSESRTVQAGWGVYINILVFGASRDQFFYVRCVPLELGLRDALLTGSKTQRGLLPFSTRPCFKLVSDSD